MIDPGVLVDSSVWIDYFRGNDTREAGLLDGLLGTRPVLVGDLILCEVLQGFAREEDFRRALRLFDTEVVECIEIGGRDIALEAARNHRTLRARGVTVRKTIDGMIATRCIVGRLTLLHADRDFLPYVEHLGLRTLA